MADGPERIPPERVSPQRISPERISQADLEGANVARMYDYFLGGSHNFAVDRELAQRSVAADPDLVRALRELRSFMRRVVVACADRGIDQFLDVGSGIPTVGNVHEVARTRIPGARVAYVDHQLVAVHHSRDLLRGVDGVSVTRANLLDADAVLTDPAVTSTLDFDRPVAVLMLAVLHFLSGDPDALVGAYRDALVPGSALAISHGSVDWDDDAVVAAMRRREEVYRDNDQPAVIRDRAEIGRFFTGMELAEPGLVEVARWRPDSEPPGAPTGYYGALGLVPRPQP